MEIDVFSFGLGVLASFIVPIPVSLVIDLIKYLIKRRKEKANTV